MNIARWFRTNLGCLFRTALMSIALILWIVFMLNLNTSSQMQNAARDQEALVQFKQVFGSDNVQIIKPDYTHSPNGTVIYSLFVDRKVQIGICAFDENGKGVVGCDRYPYPSLPR